MGIGPVSYDDTLPANQELPAPTGPEGGDPPPEDRNDVPEEVIFKTPFPRPRAGAMRNILATIAVGIVIVGLIWFFDRPGGVGSSSSITLTASASGPAPRLDKVAPDFSVRDLDGNMVALSDFRGRPVWINFWATWCPPCRAETPDIQEVYEDNQAAGLVVLGISIGEDADSVRGYMERTGTTFTTALDSDTSIAATYRIVGIPTHFFVDAEGILREWRIGSMSMKTMRKNVEAILPSGLAENE
jgi:peroxiredoxin